MVVVELRFETTKSRAEGEDCGFEVQGTSREEADCNQYQKASPRRDEGKGKLYFKLLTGIYKFEKAQKYVSKFKIKIILHGENDCILSF